MIGFKPSFRRFFELLLLPLLDVTLLATCLALLMAAFALLSLPFMMLPETVRRTPSAVYDQGTTPAACPEAWSAARDAEGKGAWKDVKCDPLRASSLLYGRRAHMRFANNA